VPLVSIEVVSKVKYDSSVVDAVLMDSWQVFYRD
jgi:hypothetical protein